MSRLELAGKLSLVLAALGGLALVPAFSSSTCIRADVLKPYG